MVTTRGIARSTGAGESVTDTRARPRTTERTDLVTAILSLWLITGLYVDGWAHLNRPSEETFFTPWHGILYTGWLGAALWISAALSVASTAVLLCVRDVRRVRVAQRPSARRARRGS